MEIVSFTKLNPTSTFQALQGWSGEGKEEDWNNTWCGNWLAHSLSSGWDKGPASHLKADWRAQVTKPPRGLGVLCWITCHLALEFTWAKETWRFFLTGRDTSPHHQFCKPILWMRGCFAGEGKGGRMTSGKQETCIWQKSPWTLENHLILQSDTKQTLLLLRTLPLCSLLTCFPTHTPSLPGHRPFSLPLSHYSEEILWNLCYSTEIPWTDVPTMVRVYY